MCVLSGRYNQEEQHETGKTGKIWQIWQQKEARKNLIKVTIRRKELKYIIIEIDESDEG